MLFLTCKGFTPLVEGGVRLAEKRVVTDTTTCSQCITIIIDLPKDCRLNGDMLAARVKECFKKEIFRDLCRGCHLESPESRDQSG